MFSLNTRESSHPMPGYDELPEVIVVGHYNSPAQVNNISVADYIMLQGFFTGSVSGGISVGDNSGGSTGGNGGPVVYSSVSGYYPNGYNYTETNNIPPADNTVPTDLPDIAVSPDLQFHAAKD